LATKYTRRHHREFWSADLFDHSMHDRWATEGSLTLLERVRARVARLRAAPREFALTAAQDAALDAILNDVLHDQSARV
jgi:trimethylamine:corrinoid methyltransferase-like protein